MVEFGMRLRELRRARGITQKELADVLGLNKSVISAYETEIRMPSFDTLLHIAAFFHVTTDYLLGVHRAQTLDLSELSEEDRRMVVLLVKRLKENGQTKR